MKEGKYNLLKALSWYTIGSMLIKAVNFFTLRLFTSLLNTSDFGIFGIYQSYLNIFEMIILFGTVHTIKMVRYDETYDYDRYVGTIIFIPIFGTIILMVITSVISCFYSIIVDLPPSIWYAIFLSACFLAVSNIVTGKLILEGEYKKYICYSLINTLLNIGISLVLCYTIFSNEDTYWARILGTLFANLISCIYVCFFIKIRKPNLQYIKSGLIMGVPLLIHSVATQILVQTDKIAISQLASYASVGVYTAATTIVTIPMTVLQSLDNSWSPWYFESLSLSKYEEIKKKNTWIVVLFALGISLFIIGCPEIVKLMTHKDYWDAVYILIPLTIASFAELIYVMPLNLELYHKKSGTIWIYTLIVVVCNILLDIVCIKLFGYIAAAYVTCFSRMLLFVLHYVRAKHIDSHDIFSLKVTGISFICLILINWFTIRFLDNWIIRWCVIIIVCIGGGIFGVVKYKKRG